MCHVLIIEDEPIIAMAIETILEDAGASTFDIVDCETDAIAAARRHRPDIIASDVLLREGTGPLAVQTIQEELGVIPVIFLTGTPKDCVPCDPPAIVLTKPFDTAQLANAFKQIGRTPRPVFE